MTPTIVLPCLDIFVSGSYLCYIFLILFGFGMLFKLIRGT